MSTEQIVSVAHRMYECRRTLRSLFGVKYDDTVGPYGKTIRQVAAERKIGAIEAALQMAKEMKEVNPDPVITLCLMAAAVDIIEPTH